MQELKWWQKAVFYQIYPRSFADGNGDGIGDFTGITTHLDYIANLGVNALWLSPCFPSPQFDVGYDISDYQDIDPDYGRLSDFLNFLDAAHQRSIQVILDLVLNHTSHLHPWFIESSSSRDNPKRNWYIWQDGKDGEPPNNWESSFGGSAWEHDPRTDQYYYHFFFKEQPDLNWRNPEVKDAMWDVVRYWLKLGVDGFRLDAIATIYEDEKLLNHTAPMGLIQLQAAYMAAQTDPEKQAVMDLGESLFQYQTQLPELHDLMKELRKVVDEFPDKVLIGEEDRIEYYGNGTDELHLIFNFPLGRTKQLTPEWIRKNQVERLGALPQEAWPCNTLGNHDQSRVWTHYAEPGYELERARLSLALILTLKGTPFLYNGEEIGMTDYYLEDPSLFRDNISTYIYRTSTEQFGLPSQEAIKIAALEGRDKNRTPMQWSDTPNAGFSPDGIQTWLPVNPNYAQGINVTNQEKAPGSLLKFYQRMVNLRLSTPALIGGQYQTFHDEAKDYLAFLRTEEKYGQSVLVVLNMSNKPLNLSFQVTAGQVECLFSSVERTRKLEDPSRIKFAPFEIYIGELSKTV